MKLAFYKLQKDILELSVNGERLYQIKEINSKENICFKNENLENCVKIEFEDIIIQSSTILNNLFIEIRLIHLRNKAHFGYEAILENERIIFDESTVIACQTIEKDYKIIFE